MSSTTREVPQEAPFESATATTDPVVLVSQGAIEGLLSKAAAFRREIEGQGGSSELLKGMLKDGIFLDVLAIPGQPTISIHLMPDGLISFRRDVTAFQMIREELARNQDEVA